jgi:hypothetical protein
VTLGDDLERATGSWWYRLSRSSRKAGIELRLLALWYVEFVLLRFQDHRDEYPSAPRRQRWRRRAGAVRGDARRSPSNHAHARTGLKRPETLCVAPPSGDDIAVVPHV